MILLTGGTGFVGRHLVQQFVADGGRVRVLSRTPGRIALPHGVSWIEGDLENPESLRSALQGVRVVVHAAAVLPGPQMSRDSLERVNVGGTESLALAAREAGVARFIHISSAGVYGDGTVPAPHRESDLPSPGDPYERSKLAAECALTAALAGSQVSWTVLRPQGIYGADRPATAAFFRDVARRRVWLRGPQRVLVHPTHITDLVAAVRLVIHHDELFGETINVGGARPVEFHELIAMIGARMGHTPLQLSAPRWTGRLARVTGRGLSLLRTPPAALARQGRAWINRAVNIDKARQLLGFEPVALEWGLDQTATELRRAATAHPDA